MELKNKNLQLYLMNKFGKSVDSITLEECNDCKILPFSGNYSSVEELKIDFSDLEKFHNLDTITISNAYITAEDIENISSYDNIKSISFSRCMFDDNALNNLGHLKKLELIGCYNDEYTFISFLSQLEELVINNPYTEASIDISLLKGNQSIKSLVFDRCILENFASLKNNKSLEFLSLLWTQLPNDCHETINSLEHLKELYIKEDYDNELLKKNNISVHTSLIDDAFDVEPDSLDENSTMLK